MVDVGHPYAVFTLISLLDLSDDGHSLQATLLALPKVAGAGERALQLVATLLEKQSPIVRGLLFDTLMTMTCDGYRHCALAACCCWKTGDSDEQEDSSKLDSGSHVATEALTSCIL